MIMLVAILPAQVPFFFFSIREITLKQICIFEKKKTSNVSFLNLKPLFAKHDRIARIDSSVWFSTKRILQQGIFFISTELTINREQSTRSFTADPTLTDFHSTPIDCILSWNSKCRGHGRTRLSLKVNSVFLSERKYTTPPTYLLTVVTHLSFTAPSG